MKSPHLPKNIHTCQKLKNLRPHITELTDHRDTVWAFSKSLLSLKSYEAETLSYHESCLNDGYNVQFLYKEFLRGGSGMMILEDVVYGAAKLLLLLVFPIFCPSRIYQ